MPRKSRVTNELAGRAETINIGQQSATFENMSGDLAGVGGIGTSLNSNSPIRPTNADHHRKMSDVAGGVHSSHLNQFVSPYSVLRGSTERDVDITLNKLQQGANAAGLVMRSNRTQLLRQLQLKQKFD